MKTKFKYVFLTGALLFILCQATTACPESVPPFAYQIENNGDVVVQDGYLEIARIFPWIFTGKRTRHHWQGSFLYKETTPSGPSQGSGTLMVNHVPVDMDYKVECLETGLKIHYRLEPRETLQASAVEVYCRFPYGDWQGCSFDFNGQKGFIPIDAWNEKNPDSAWLIEQSANSPLVLGPSRYHSALTARLDPQNLNVLLADDRRENPKLSIVLNHDDVPGYGSNPPPNWIWEKGQAKEFDFTLTFNRAMDCSTQSTPATAKTTASTPVFSPTVIATPDFSGFLSTLLAVSPTPLALVTSEQEHNRVEVAPSSPPTSSFPQLDLPPMPGKLALLTLPTPTSTPNPPLSFFPTESPNSLPITGISTPIPEPISSLAQNSKVALLTPYTSLPSLGLPMKLIQQPLYVQPTPDCTTTPTPRWTSYIDKGQTVKFTDPPANIYVVFGDGPGRYRSEVVNTQGKLMEVIDDRQIAGQIEAWLAWDCQNGQGVLAPPGQYFVMIYKDGQLLKSLSILRLSKTR